MKHESLWASIEKELACALPAHAISTWFDPISPLCLSGGELVLEAPNQFFYEWIESHYKQNLKRAISVVTDETIKHRLVVSTGKTDLNTGGNGVFPQSQIETKYPKPNINKNYLFESFIEGANNQFAKTAAEAVAENPGKQSFNPLIVYGGTGLGKTHLLHAIGNRVLETQPDRRIVIATSEKFT